MMFKQKMYTCLTIGILAISCGSKTDTGTDTIIQDIDTTAVQQDTTTVFRGEDERAENQSILQPFTGLPKDVEGCSCYYSFTDADFKNNKYVFAAGYESEGFANLSGEMGKLKFVKEESASPAHSIKWYQGDKYGIIIETEKTGEIDETWQQKGKLTVTEGGKEVFYIDITGECGC